ncbi:TRAP transporter small permease [Lonepinella koalarum]|uniref:TRAP transporter small permease protein n=1 Tax=Lonepinella koalarum TaxID=53417 RepID=A0A4R1KZM7_9PAST|nr:TRAP transporter small permease [Lonepinella koalarum]MDH2926584.1 C4-dicarboxylate ABC transporter [Lonepinella koalarum]TCK69479.1 C4-dicarboxylate transporter DctQ subunit [Lonepinella koalarum]TFJ89726.1 TRAP transporter small permease [Lonepinella koalarum]TYG33993.1 TRAP transporter small permease [Lonepinella koalarum]
MSYLIWFWHRIEECAIAILLTVMTAVTFIYVVFNNLYNVFFDLAEALPSIAHIAEPIGDFIMMLAQEMTWSLAVTKACFGWLIFFGASYGVRMGGHIGVDAIVKKMSEPAQRVTSIIAACCCLVYAAMITIASYEWIEAVFISQIGADDLHQFNIKLWHIGMIMPIGFALIGLRFVEILINLIRGKQYTLGLADESKDALKLAQGENE